MNDQELCDHIFSIDKQIRYVTVTDRHLDVLAGGMRPGIKPLESTKEEEDEITLQVSMLDGVMRSWTESLGSARFALIQHQKGYMLILPFDNKHLELSIETSASIEEISKMVVMIENALGQRYGSV